MARRYGRIALINPPWTFDGSRYWACKETHVPLELLYTQALLKQAGLEATVIDAHLEGLTHEETAARTAELGSDLVVLTTAPSYLFWRCPPPELTVPLEACRHLAAVAPIVAIGPHGSATPGYVLEKLRCAAVIRGEPEFEVVQLALGEPGQGTVLADSASPDESHAAVVDVSRLPVLDFAEYPLELRSHRHHVFFGEGRGAEVEYSRGCPYGCTFCNRRFFRSRFRARPVDSVMKELRTLRARGVDYVYFIDEVFGLGKARGFLDVLAAERPVKFGCQTRLDLWDEGGIEQLASAGCISVEFGLESPFPTQQRSVNKGYEIDAERILEKMVFAKSLIPWVQGDLMELPVSDPELTKRTEEWRQRAIASGVWVSEPVDLFLYPGSDLHDELLGPIDDSSWERALEASRE